MRAHEKVELILIPLANLVFWKFTDKLPQEIQIGYLCTLLSLTLLIQGFFRDIWLLYLQKTRYKNSPKRKIKCMCFESTVGMSGIIAGIILFFVMDVTRT